MSKDNFMPSAIPSLESNIMIICGILDFFLFGIGTIILGVLDNCNVWCVIIGILQLCIPFVGWLWSIIWGVIILMKDSVIQFENVTIQIVYGDWSQHLAAVNDNLKQAIEKYIDS
eukprot:gene8006-9405_t